MGRDSSRPYPASASMRVGSNLGYFMIFHMNAGLNYPRKNMAEMFFFFLMTGLQK